MTAKMYLKYVLIPLICLTLSIGSQLVTGFQFAVEEHSNSAKPSSYWDDYDVALEQLEQLLSQTVEVVIGQSQILSEALGSTIRNATEQYEAVVQEGYESISKQLLALQVIADAAGCPQCLGDKVEELEVIKEGVAWITSVCMTQPEADAANLISSLNSTVDEAIEELDSIKKEMEENCPESSESPEDLECITIILDRIQTAKDVLPTRMLDESLRATSMMETHEDLIFNCVDSLSGLIFSEGNRIVSEVERCITDPESRSLREKFPPI